jgi:hypothetical protein
MCLGSTATLCVARAPRSFGFIARHIGANFPDARAHPVLPDKQRLQGKIARTNQVSIEAVMATLTHEGQSLVGAIVLTGMPAPGTCLAGGVGMHFHRHTACQQCLVCKISLQFGTGQLRGVPVRTSLPLRGLLSMPAIGTFTDMGQVFQADEAVGVLVYNVLTDEAVDRLFQPSLPSTEHYQSPGSGTGADLVQPPSQSCIAVRFGSGLCAGIEGAASTTIRLAGPASGLHSNGRHPVCWSH